MSFIHLAPKLRRDSNFYKKHFPIQSDLFLESEWISEVIPKNKLTLLSCLQEGFAPPEEAANDGNDYGYEDEQDEY